MFIAKILVLLLASPMVPMGNHGGESINSEHAVLAAQADTSGPLLTTHHWPVNPGPADRIEFVAAARDPSGLSNIEILVNARVVKQCPNAIECVYTGGPYPAGQVTYAANATDSAGNSSFEDYKYITVGEAQTTSGKVKVSVHVLDGAGGVPVQGARVDFTNLGTGNTGWRTTGADGVVTYWVDPGTDLRMAPKASGYRFDEFEFTVNSDRKYYLKGTKLSNRTACTVRGQVTGEVQLVKSIGVYRPESRHKFTESLVDAEGRYSIGALPEERIRVLLEVEGKFSPDAEPYFYDLDCRNGTEFTNKNFHLHGVWEG
jgi:hypothetical protein